jgi:hypothetical protein
MTFAPSGGNRKREREREREGVTRENFNFLL